MDDDPVARTKLAPCPPESGGRVDCDRSTRSEGRLREARRIPPCSCRRTRTSTIRRTIAERFRGVRCLRRSHSRGHHQYEHQWQQRQDCVAQPSSDTPICSPQDGPPASKEPHHGNQGRTTLVSRHLPPTPVLCSPFPGGSGWTSCGTLPRAAVVVGRPTALSAGITWREVARRG